MKAGGSRASRGHPHHAGTAELLAAGGPGVPLFFAQLEAAETIIFLTEARADFLQGIEVPSDEPSEDASRGLPGLPALRLQDGHGTGQDHRHGMLAAWSILNKVNDRSDARFSDVVLVVCPT